MSRPLTINTFVTPSSFSSLPTRVYSRDEEITQRSREMNAKYAPLVFKVPGQSHCDSKYGSIVSLVYPCAPDHARMLIVAEFSELLFWTDGV
jgi:hypothetical protein